MIDHDTALELARKHLTTLPVPAGQELVVNEAATAERPVGWVFFFQSKKFLETGDVNDSIVGNGPILVDKRDGSLHQFNTAVYWTKQADDYEAAHP
jgi:hypothetical protein